MRLKKYLETYEPHWITRIFSCFNTGYLFGNMSKNEMKEKLENLLDADMDDLIIQNINYAYFLKKELGLK